MPVSTTSLSIWKNWLTTVCRYPQHVSIGLDLVLRWRSNLQALELLEPLLDKLLHLPWVLNLFVLPESVSRPPLGIFSEVVGRKVATLAQELSVL